MTKIAMIGAGSVVFSRNLTGDILGYPELSDATMSYMDIDEARLEAAGLMCKKVADALGAKPKIETTTDMKEALRGADFVINMVQIGGFGSTLVDFEIPRKYGLNFTIADTTGPGGLFRALRTYPMMTELCRDMEKVCPDAVLLNYSNPMSMNMQSVFRTIGVKAVGLCHSVQGTFNVLMRYLGEDPNECNFICAGINHMAFFLSLEKDGQDLYPRLFEAEKDPKIGNSNKVRFELMKRLGYFPTESSEHHAEYSPWFIKHGKEKIREYNIPIDEYLRRCDANTREFERVKEFAHSDKPLEVKRSHEYGSLIIHSIVTGIPRVVYGNLPNNGAISNLPDDAVVEVPTLVDRSGMQTTVVGDLPPQLIGYIHPHIMQHELFIRAATEGRRDYVYQAAMNDPLTSSILSLDQTVEMCDELIAAHGDYLPKLKKHSLIPTSGRRFNRIDPQTFEAEYEERKDADLADYVEEWNVVGPFPAEKEEPPILKMKTPVEAEFKKIGKGLVDLNASYQNCTSKIGWRKQKIDDKGRIVFDKTLGTREWAAAYAYAEVIMPASKEVLLSCGSDDGMAIWLNGKQVHQVECDRSIVANDDEFLVPLEAGVNKILVKVVNHHNGWGFCLALRNLS